jgi:ABC-2 type transport system ATP-binding protein
LSSGALLEVKGISRTFGRVRAVNELSFTLEKGRVVGFIGPNGAGKTTTMRILSTLDLPDKGDVFVEGLSVLEEPRKVRAKVGFMADLFVPYANLDVVEFLDFFARAYGLKGKKRTSTVASVARFCGLTEFLDRPVSGLSKGMGQRVHLAKTLLHDPMLLILDEPTAGLDPRARTEFRELVKELAAAGKGVLVSSHILSELAEVCDGVLVIEKGCLVVSGGIEDIASQVNQHLPVQVRVLADSEAAERFFLTQPMVREPVREDSTITFDFTGTEAELSQLLSRAVGAGLNVVEFRTLQASLEEIYLRATQGKLQ